jgi:hypothetical protein
VISNTGDLSNTNEIELPTQTGNSGKYLTTNGTAPSWATVAGGDGNGIYSGSGNIPNATHADFNSALTTWGTGVTGRMLFNLSPYYETAVGDGFKFVGMEVRDPTYGNYGHFGFSNEEPGSLKFTSFNDGTGNQASMSFTPNGTYFSSGLNYFESTCGTCSETDDILSFVLTGLGRAKIKDQRSFSGGNAWGLEYGEALPLVKTNDLSLINSRAVKDLIRDSIGTTRKMFGYSGSTTATTSGTGTVTITHGVGTTPVVTTATYIGNNAYTVTITAKTSTTFTAKVWNDSGASVNSTSVTIDWYAR